MRSVEVGSLRINEVGLLPDLCEPVSAASLCAAASPGPWGSQAHFRCCLKDAQA